MTELDFSFNGQTVITDTTPATGQFYAMQVIADAVVASMTFEPDYDSSGDWSDLGTIPAGTTICGRFSALTLTSGKVILHHL